MLSFAVKALLITAAIALWAVASHVGWLNPRLFPAPSDVGVAAWQLLQKPEVRAELLTTTISLVTTLLIAVPAGVVIGAVISTSRYWTEVIKPILFFPLSIPKSIFLPLFILVLGIGQVEKIAFGVFSVIFLIIVFTISAIESVEPAHLRVARSVGASQAQTLFRVYIPSMLPTLLEGLRLSVIFAVTAVILAEMYASRSGFGTLISAWGEGFQVVQLMASVVIISVLAIVANEAIRWFEHRFEKWRTK
jgi:ABC-type nitrate/sulfonate/bicarbonate transport system permease component